jgi:NAD(P)-dependent dehydrogenase (short-subunit alcohol dehydrogenase family)
LRRVVVTGVTGTLGSALARLHAERGDEVIGVSRQSDAKHEWCTRVVTNAQRDAADARALLALAPDLVVLCAGAIETQVGPDALPLPDATVSLFEVNAIFPALVATLAAAEPRAAAGPLEIVAIGSIADAMPSAFGPVYHASKSALHFLVQGLAPIARDADARVRLRLYRPGVIRGPLAEAPMLRLNDRGRRLRARRCARAPDASLVAARIARWIDGDATIGSCPSPLSFRALGLLFALAPGLYARLQDVGWRRGGVRA